MTPDNVEHALFVCKRWAAQREQHLPRLQRLMCDDGEWTEALESQASTPLSKAILVLAAPDRPSTQDGRAKVTQVVTDWLIDIENNHPTASRMKNGERLSKLHYLPPLPPKVTLAENFVGVRVVEFGFAASFSPRGRTKELGVFITAEEAAAAHDDAARQHRSKGLRLNFATTAEAAQRIAAARRAIDNGSNTPAPQEDVRSRWSQYKGVERISPVKWVAMLHTNGVRRILGTFASDVEASKAYKEALARIRPEDVYLRRAQHPPRRSGRTRSVVARLTYDVATSAAIAETKRLRLHTKHPHLAAVGMCKWGEYPREQWQGPCLAEGCECTSAVFTCCFSCNLCAHTDCLDAPNLANALSIEDEWLCPECHDLYKKKTAPNAALEALEVPAWGTYPDRSHWNDACIEVGCTAQGGHVLCCYSCNLVVHPQCAFQPVVDVEDNWFCQVCHEVYLQRVQHRATISNTAAHTHVDPAPTMPR